MQEVWYGSVTLFTSILHNVFLLYHVETFIMVYKIDKTSFWFGEIIFLVWNSVNDPLFGWVSDRRLLDEHEQTSSISIIMSRIHAVRTYGPLFAVSFLTFWVSWTYPTLQFVICLCLYDGFLTVIDLNHSALMADLAVSVKSRTNLNFYSSVFSIFGSSSVFVSYMMWHQEDRSLFQFYCLVLSVISLMGFLVATSYLKFYCVNTSESSGKAEKLRKESSICSADRLGQDRQYLRSYVRQVLRHKNFLWFSVINLVQVFHCHFNSNFFPLFLETLMDGVSPAVCSVLLGLSFVAPHVNNLYFTSLCSRYGVHTVVTGLFSLKLVLSGGLMVIGPDNVVALAFFIASNRIFTEGTCKLLCLVISDLVDEDYVLHQRAQPVSALVFGTANLLSKPGQTFAPLIGMSLLGLQTGYDVFESSDSLGGLKVALSGRSIQHDTVFRQACFSLLTYVPVVCALIQLLAWSRFDLHGSRLAYVKSRRCQTGDVLDV